MTITLNGTTGITNDGAYTGDGISFADNAPSNSLVVNSSGNVGIGTGSPSQKLTIAGNFRLENTTNFVVSASGSNYQLINSGAGAFQFFTNGSERMRIDSIGNLLVGTTSAPSASVNGGQIGSDGKLLISIASGTTSNANFYRPDNGVIQYFIRNSSIVGSISVATSTTTYSTSSDYRLKENIQPMQGALATVAQLNPVTYTWKADGSEGQGFIAHELQAVVPDCVTGEKDAVDEEGNPVYQGIDTSFLVATLTKAIQELSAKNDELETRLAALEAK